MELACLPNFLGFCYVTSLCMLGKMLFKMALNPKQERSTKMESSNI